MYRVNKKQFLFLIIIPLIISCFRNEKNCCKKFANGIITTKDKYEIGTTFSSDQKELYFIRKSISDSNHKEIFTIYYSTSINNKKWSKPVIAEFSGEYNDIDPFIIPDGSKLFLHQTDLLIVIKREGLITSGL